MIKYSFRKSSQNYIFLYLLALIPRLIYLFQVKDNPFFNALDLDPLYYDKTALKILGGDLLAGNHIFDLSPLYSYFLASIYAIFGHSLFISRLIQHLIGAGSCVLLFIIGKKNFTPTVGAIAYIISSLCGIFIFYEGVLQTETLVIFVNLLTVLALMNSHFFVAGSLIGISAIIRPNILLIIPFLFLWIYFRKKKQPVFAKIAAIAIGAAIFILPVTLRNYYFEKDFVLISSSGGMNFYIGNNENATGILTEPDFIRPNPEFEHKDARTKAEEITGKKLLPSQTSKFWFKKGLEDIINNPSSYLSLIAKKINFSINYYEIPDNRNYYFFSRFSSLLRLPLFSSRIIIPLGLIGLCLSLKKKENLILLYLFITCYGISLLLFFVSSRYRLPIMPFMIIFSAYSIEWIFIKYKEKKIKHFTYTLLALLCLILFVNKENPLIKNIFLSQSYQSLATVFYKDGDYKKAEETIKKAVEINPGNAEASNNLAWIYAAKGINLGRALELSRLAIKTTSTNAGYYDTLGWVYYKMNRLEDAINALNKGLLLDPDNRDILKHKREIIKD